MSWIRRWVRKSFCKNEIQKGQVLVIWKDVDNIVYGWSCNADKEEKVLTNVGKIMRETKREKLEQAIGKIKNI